VSIRKAVSRERGRRNREIHARREFEQGRPRALPLDPVAYDEERRFRSIDFLNDAIEIARDRRQAAADGPNGRITAERLYVLGEDEQSRSAPRAMDAFDR
jgi:hypothetical protein